MNEIIITAILAVTFLTMWAAWIYSEWELERLQKRQTEYLKEISEYVDKLESFAKEKL